MSVSEETLQTLLARLAYERAEADTRYNQALTALDRALTPAVALPPTPPASDTPRLPDLHRQWDTAPVAPVLGDRSIKGRIRTLVWRLVGPPLEAQRTFNATLVDHLQQQAVAARQVRDSVAALLETLTRREEARVRFESHLLQYLQTVTWFVDTRDRSAGSKAEAVNAGLHLITDEFRRHWESLETREARWRQHVDALAASLDEVRATSTLAHDTALAARRELTSRPPADQAAARQPPTDRAAEVRSAPPAGESELDPSTYLSFENAFRGSPDDIRARQAVYGPLFDGRTDVVELGCGRGEFLEFLRERGVRARGVDTNAAMVQEARARGLEAVHADAVTYLTGLSDGSLDGVFAAQVVEHLSPGYLVHLLALIQTKLRPGGVVVLETINPSCWLAFFESYIRDITHVRALHPDTLQFLVRAAGFQRVRVEYSAPVPEAARLASVPPVFALNDPVLRDAFETLAAGVNANVEALNARLFGFQDYAVVAET